MSAKLPFRQLILSALLFVATPSWAKSFKPTSPDQIVETLTRQGLDTAIPHDLRQLRLALQKTPSDLALALPLTIELLSLGRKTSDPRFYGEAQAILKPWWDLPSPPIEVLPHRANILQFNHQFQNALADLGKYLGAAPQDTQARIMEATIFQVLGQYEKSKLSCGLIVGRRAGTIKSLCLAASRAMLEDPKAVFAELKVLTGFALAGTEAQSNLSPESVYALGIQADIAIQLNDVEFAIESLKSILKSQPNDIYAAVTLSDVYLDQNRFEDAASIACRNPDHEGLLLRCARAIRTKDPERFASIRKISGELFAAEKRRDSPPHLREIAYYQLYLLDDPKTALGTAKENYNTQREPVDASLLLEAAAKAGTSKEAAEVLRWMQSTRYQYDRFAALQRILEGSAK